jgi:hypothetical protein
VEKQLTLFETPAPDAPRVWSTLSAEERALAISVLARLMARAVANLGNRGADPEDSHD